MESLAAIPQNDKLASLSYLGVPAWLFIYPATLAPNSLQFPAQRGFCLEKFVVITLLAATNLEHSIHVFEEASNCFARH